MILYLFILIIRIAVLFLEGVTVESLCFREFVEANGLSITAGSISYIIAHWVFALVSVLFIFMGMVCSFCAKHTEVMMLMGSLYAFFRVFNTFLVLSGLSKKTSLSIVVDRFLVLAAIFVIILCANTFNLWSYFIRSRESFKDLPADQIGSPNRMEQAVQLVSNCRVGVRIGLITVRLSLFTHGKMSEKYVSKVATLFSLIETRLPGLCNSIVVSDLIAHRLKYKTTSSLIRSVGIWYFAFVLVVLQMLKLFSVGTGMPYTVSQCYTMVAPLFSKAKRVRDSRISFDLTGAGLVKYLEDSQKGGDRPRSKPRAKKK